MAFLSLNSSIGLYNETSKSSLQWYRPYLKLFVGLYTIAHHHCSLSGFHSDWTVLTLHSGSTVGAVLTLHSGSTVGAVLTLHSGSTVVVLHSGSLAHHLLTVNCQKTFHLYEKNLLLIQGHKETIHTLYMKKEKNLSPSQGLNLGLPNTSQMLLPLRHQDS